LIGVIVTWFSAKSVASTRMTQVNRHCVTLGKKARNGVNDLIFRYKRDTRKMFSLPLIT